MRYRTTLKGRFEENKCVEETTLHVLFQDMPVAGFQVATKSGGVRSA